MIFFINARVHALPMKSWQLLYKSLKPCFKYLGFFKFFFSVYQKCANTRRFAKFNCVVNVVLVFVFFLFILLFFFFAFLAAFSGRVACSLRRKSKLCGKVSEEYSDTTGTGISRYIYYVTNAVQRFRKPLII